MKADSILYWILYFVITVIVAWIALSLILMWFSPALNNPDGSVNWWVTLWVAALIILFAWIIMILLSLLISLFQGFGNCKKDKCPPVTEQCLKPCPPVTEQCPPKPCPPVDPCATPINNEIPSYDPRMWLRT